MLTPLLDSLGFAATHLAVAYRGSLDPQVLSIRVRTSGPAKVPFGPAAIRTFVELVNEGGAGGSEFAPWAGRAKLLSSPDDEAGVDRAWSVEVAGVSPRFLRTLIESLRRAGDEHDVTALTIDGSLKLDDGPLSVREPQVQRWLASPTEYPGAWGEIPFRVRDREVTRGARVRARLAEGASVEILEAFESTMMSWSLAILDYADRRHDGRGTMDRDPRIGRTRSEVAANFAELTYDPVAAYASLINLLCGFHARVAKIEEVEIGL